MKQILHLVWFDLRALKWWFAAWGAALLVQVLSYTVVPSRPFSPEANAEAVARVGVSLDAMWRTGLPILPLGLAALIAALIVQRDPSHGTAARWLTMPIPRWQMLASKLLTAVGALVLLPVVIAASALLLLGLFPGDAVRGAWPVAVEHAVPVLLSIALAAVTSSLTHLLMALGGAFALFLLFTASLLPALTSWWPDASIDVGGLRLAVLAGVPLLGAGAAISHQYLTLRTRRSIAIIACSFVLSAGSSWLVRGVAAAPPSKVVDRAVVDPDKVSITFGLDDLRSYSRWRGAPESREQITDAYSSVKTVGQPAHVILRPERVESEIRYTDSVPVRTSPEGQRPWLLGDREHGEDMIHLSIQEALRDTELLRDDSLWPGRTVYKIELIELPSVAFNRFVTRTGSFSAQVTFRAFRYRVQAAIPVNPGASFTLPAKHLSVVSVGRNRSPSRSRRDNLQIWVRITSFSDFEYSFQPPSCYVLRNVSRRQAVYLMPFRAATSRSVPLGWTGTTLGVVTSPLEPWWIPPQGTKSPFDDEWMKGAELVELGPENLGVLTRQVRVDNFSLKSVRTNW